MDSDSHKQPSGKCPRCNSEASYKYGKTRHGKQRFRCLLCGRQFGDNARVELKERPLCSECGQKMHLYRKDPGWVRFRCSAYPSCRNYEKLKKGEYELLLPCYAIESVDRGSVDTTD
jgi:ssDNA-binding Zn-finger/Zn-ribbon topoisomerase 1